MHVFSKSAVCPNNEIASCKKAYAYGISAIPMPDASFLCSQVNFQVRVIQLHLDLSVNARNLFTPVHTWLMPAFFGLNLGI